VRFNYPSHIFGSRDQNSITLMLTRKSIFMNMHKCVCSFSLVFTLQGGPKNWHILFYTPELHQILTDIQTYFTVKSGEHL